MLKLPLLSFAHLLERQASSISATMVLPKPDSGQFCFRLSRFPLDGTETIVDIYSNGHRVFVTVTRFLLSLRVLLGNSKTEDACFRNFPVEISTSECDKLNPLIREISTSQIFDISSRLSDGERDDHFFLFYIDLNNCIAAGISNPYQNQNELWIRLINRSFGTELVAPRRNIKTATNF